MSDPGSKSVTVAKLVNEFLANYDEHLTDYVSDANYAPILLDSTFFAITDADDQEAFFATSSYLDTFLLSSVPSMVSFSENGLTNWCREALEFSRENSSHPTFIEIFSSRMQHDIVLKSLLRFDFSGNFMNDYFRQIRIDNAFVDEELPPLFQQAVRSVAEEAIRPTLRSLAGFLESSQRRNEQKSRRKSQSTKSIANSTSFLNKKGTIVFSERLGKFRIDPSKTLDQLAEYRPVVDRAISKLVDAKTLTRLDNKDRILTGLLSEYSIEIDKASQDISLPILWTIGVELELRLRRQENGLSEDEQIDAEDLFDLRRLMSSHNLFLNCFEQAKSLLNDVEAAAAIYQRVDAAARQVPSLVLREVSRNDALIEQSSVQAITRAINLDAHDGTIESKGIVALKLGLLRGLLQAAGGFVLKGVEAVLSRAAVMVGANLIVDALRSDARFVALLEFLHNQAVALIKLSDQMPVYFGYIRNILLLLGIPV